MLAQSVISRVLTDATVQEGDLPERVMAAMLNDIDLPAAITIGLDIDQDGKQISRTLVAFDRATPAVRRLLEAHVDLIVQSSRQTIRFRPNCGWRDGSRQTH